jgi:hypothetical protein
MGCGRSQVSWLGAPHRAFPERRRHSSGSMRQINARSQWRDRAGFSPDFPRPPADERAHPTPPAGRPRHGQARRTSLESRGGRPPSSRGLGRRPLTAETGVRIPVAVYADPSCLLAFSASEGLRGEENRAAPLRRLRRRRRPGCPARHRRAPSPRAQRRARGRSPRPSPQPLVAAPSAAQPEAVRRYVYVGRPGGRLHDDGVGVQAGPSRRPRGTDGRRGSAAGFNSQPLGPQRV